VSDLGSHYYAVVDALAARYYGLVWVLGAGVNLWSRGPEPSFLPGTKLPDGTELASYLAQEFRYPQRSDQLPWLELAQVSQYVATVRGKQPLYGTLRTIFELEYETTPVHRLLAGLPRRLRDMGCPRPHQLILTTNYDDLLEQAFRDCNEPYDLLVYQADREPRGRFVHFAPGGGEPTPILLANDYRELSLEERSVIMKVHGTCERDDRRRDSFVITEDDYIDYLGHSGRPGDFIPAVLIAQMRESAFLFLGYGLRDWNIRVILRWIWGDQPLGSRSWAVQRDVDTVQREIWDRRNVEILDEHLELYVEGLEQQLDEATERGRTA
jgi:hypothetical protein